MKELFGAKDAQGDWVLAKADGAPYDLYRDGIQVHTTIDSRLQAAAETGTATPWRGAAGHPQLDSAHAQQIGMAFYEGIERSDRDLIINQAKKQSERYRIYAGKFCPECERPGFYIEKDDNAKAVQLALRRGERRRSHTRHRPSTKEIDAKFKEPVEMRVFTHKGPRDTVLSPLDSILYHKSLLHAGLMSIEPQTGHVKAWVGGMDYRYFKHDNVAIQGRGSIFKPFVYATALRYGMERCTNCPTNASALKCPVTSPIGARTTVISSTVKS